MSAASARGRRAVSLRQQVLGTVLAINAVAALVAGAVVVLNARAAARNEMAASVEMAELMVREAAERIAAEGAGDSPLPTHLRHLRHVRLTVRDAAGAPLSLGDAPAGAHHEADDDARAPAWFARLADVPALVRTIDVNREGLLLFQVEVAGVPDDEIAEVWGDVTDFALVAVAVNGAILLALFLALGRVRAGLGRFRVTLDALEHQRAVEPLAPPRIRELAELAHGVNALAAALSAARAENVRLNARLVRLQEDERRQIAGALHDELGPLMFGLKAGAESIARLAGQMTQPAPLPEPLAGRLRERAEGLVAIVARMQVANRRLLRRIRPAALDHVPLADALASLVQDLNQHDAGRAVALELGRLAGHYGPALDATLYRCVQEGVTNALRHGDAHRVEVALAEGDGRLRLVITDDGRGPPAVVREGLGLAGMRERVRALGGTCRLEPGAAGGARLWLDLPVPADDLRDEAS